jgi:hypothetical protein
MKDLFKAAVAFLLDADARTTSQLTYPNGSAMSVAEAKRYEFKGYLELLEFESKYKHGAVTGSYETISIDQVKEHNRFLYEHLEGLSLLEWETQVNNQQGRLWAWWRAGVISDVEHNEMLEEIRNKAIKAILRKQAESTIS